MTRKQPRERRLRSVIEAAVDEFVEKGYEGASMDSIAARAGLTKGGLYHHFGSKDQLLHAANESFQKPIEAMIETALAHPSPSEGIRGFIRDYIEYWVSHSRDLAFTLLSLYKALGNPAMMPSLGDYARQMIGFYEGRFAVAVEQGELRPHDCHARALVLMAMLDGVTAYAASGSLPAKDAIAAATSVCVDEIASV